MTAPPGGVGGLPVTGGGFGLGLRFFGLGFGDVLGVGLGVAVADGLTVGDGEALAVEVAALIAASVAIAGALATVRGAAAPLAG